MRTARAALLALLGLAPACLLAPPRPGATADAGPGDARESHRAAPLPVTAHRVQAPARR